MVRVVVELDGGLEQPLGDDPSRPLPADLAGLVHPAVDHHPTCGPDLLQGLGAVHAAGPPAGDRRLPGGAVHAPAVVFFEPGGEPGIELPQGVRALDGELGEKRRLQRAPESLLLALLMRSCA